MEFGWTSWTSFVNLKMHVRSSFEMSCVEKFVTTRGWYRRKKPRVYFEIVSVKVHCSYRPARSGAIRVWYETIELAELKLKLQKLALIVARNKKSKWK